MTWLIAGGTGQLGLALQTELEIRGIAFLAKNSTALDISEPEAVEQFIDRLKPNVVINAAAWTDVDGAETNQSTAFSINTLGAKNLAMATKNLEATFVQISTDYVFSGQASSPWDENALQEPQCVYGKSKSEGEILVNEIFSGGCYVVRTAWLYSEHKKNFAKTITRLAFMGKDEIRVVNDQTGQPTYAGDVAKQIIELVSAEAPSGFYHATNSAQATWFEFAQEIFKQVGADVSRVIPVSTDEFPRPAKRPAYSVLGHGAWSKTRVPAMRDWRLALTEAMPAIISSVNTE